MPITLSSAGNERKSWSQPRTLLTEQVNLQNCSFEQNQVTAVLLVDKLLMQDFHENLEGIKGFSQI